MSTGPWRDRVWWWAPALGLVIVNLVLLIWFQVVYSGAARSVDQQLERRQAELARFEQVLAEQREVGELVRFNTEQVDGFYSSRLATSEQRLTAILREVRQLAASAGLRPSSFSYPEDKIEEFGLEKRGVNFDVEGSYLALRRFINLLELSDSFLTLEEVHLSGRGAEGALRITLRLSTLFSIRPASGRRAPAEEQEAAAS